MTVYLISCIKFSLSFLKFFSLFCKIYVLIECFLVDMTKLLQLIIADVQRFLQIFSIPPLVPIMSKKEKSQLKVAKTTVQRKW